MEPIRFTSKLLEIKVINEDTKILKFSSPEGFDFVAGQYVMMAFYKDEKRILRSYSIFSSPSEKEYFLVYFKKVGEGFASNNLFNMKVGDEIEMKGPVGTFNVENKEKDICFISAGTGFGPFRSMIFDLLEKGFKKKLILIRGYRNETSLCCEEELKKLKEIYPNFEFYNVLSQPKDEKFPNKGRVQNFLENFIPKGFKGDFYLCGLKEMIEESKEKLLSLGFSSTHFFSERYD